MTSHRIWRYFYDKDKDFLEVMEEDVIVIFEPVQVSRCKFTRRGTAGYDKPKGLPATVKETLEGHLKLREVGKIFAQEGNG